MVGNHLGDRPVDLRERAAAEKKRRRALLAHLCRKNVNLQGDIEAARGLILRGHEMGQRRRIAYGPREGRGPERRQRRRGDDERRYRRCKVLGEERAERLGFPRLDVARRPVVEQAIAEHMRAGFEFQLIVEAARGPIDGHDILAALGLARRPPHRNAAHLHRGGAAVIGDGTYL